MVPHSLLGGRMFVSLAVVWALLGTVVNVMVLGALMAAKKSASQDPA